MADQIIDPFAIVGSLKGKNEEVNKRAGEADSFLQDYIAQVDKVQDVRKESLEKTVQAKQAVNQQVQQQTQDFSKSVQPLFQKRQAIVDRKVELEEMNPIKKAIFGIFDRNYQESHLEKLDQGVTEQLQVRGQEYQQLMGIQDTIVKGIESAFNDQDAVNQLELANGEQDVQLRMQGVGSAQQVFKAELAGLEAQSEVMVAQARARQDLLSGMSPGEVNNALGQAKKSGGQVMINGIPLRVGELQSAANQWQEQALALESRQLAVQAGRMDLADRYEERMIKTMTAPQIQAAIANGGVFKGQTLNQEALTRAYASMTQRNQIIAANASTESAIPIAHAMIRQIGNNTTGTNQRAVGLFGQLPREMQQQALSIATRIKGFAEAERKAREAGASAEFVQSQLPMFKGLLDEQAALQDKMAERWAGGNKDLKAVAIAWMSGSPLNSESAAKGLITLARNGMPAGTKLSGPAKAAFEQAQRIVAAHDKGDPGKPINLLMQGGKKKDMDPDLVQAVSSSIRSLYTNNSMKEVLAASPQLAAQIQGPDGQPHPFSRVRPEDFHSAQALGDSQGYKLLGQKLGLSEDQTRILFGPNGASSDAFKKAKAKNPDLDMGQARRDLVATQTSAFLNALDHTPSAVNGFKPSQAFTSLMANPRYQQMASNAVAGQGQSSAGDYMTSAIGSTGFESALYGYNQVVQRSYSQLQANATQQAIESSQKLRNASPWDSATITLNTIDGISPQEANVLLAAVKQAANQRGIRLDSGLGPTAGAQTADAIDSIITKTKFNDPNLERIRQTAARDWAPRRQQIYKGLTGLMRAIDDIDTGKAPTDGTYTDMGMR